MSSKDFDCRPKGLDIEPKEGGYYQAHDGLWYTYQDKAKANRLYMQEHFGLAELWEESKRANMKAKVNGKVSSPKQDAKQPVRRSPRIRLLQRRLYRNSAIRRKKGASTKHSERKGGSIRI